MSEIKTRPVGEQFEHEGVALEVVETNTFFCDGCHWQKKGNACDFLGYVAVGGACAQNVRSDGKSVIFKEINHQKTDI